MSKCALVTTLLIACLTSLSGVAIAQSTSTCTLVDRNTINPATGLPYCVKVALLRDGASSAPYYTNTLPQRVFNRTIQDLTSQVNVEITQSDLIWEQGISAVQNGTYDIFIANIWVLQRRVRLIDFSAPFTSETLGLMYLKPATQEKLLGFLDPLHYWVWIGILFTFLVGGLVIAMAELAHPCSKPDTAEDQKNPLADRTRIGYTLKQCMLHSINIPFGTMEFHCKSAIGKLAQWMVAFFFLILLATYTANLASFLTVQSAGRIVTKDTLLRSPVLAGPGDTAPFISALGGTVINVGFPEAGVNGLLNRPSAASYVGASNQLQSMVNTDCRVSWLRLDVPIDSALVFRQQESVTRFKRAVDAVMLSMKEDGTLDAWTKEGLPTDSCSTDAVLDSSTALRFGSLAGVFLICGVGLGVLLLAAIVRFCIDVFGDKKKYSAPDSSNSSGKEASQAPMGDTSAPPPPKHNPYLGDSQEPAATDY